MEQMDEYEGCGLWIERNVLPRSADRDQPLIPSGEFEGYVRDVIVHVGDPGTPGD